MRTSKRDRIITGALELAHRDGFDALTFDALAEHVGLTRGGVIYHFRTKTDLLEGIAAPMPEAFVGWRGNDFPPADAAMMMQMGAEGVFVGCQAIAGEDVAAVEKVLGDVAMQVHGGADHGLRADDRSNGVNEVALGVVHALGAQGAVGVEEEAVERAGSGEALEDLGLPRLVGATLDDAARIVGCWNALAKRSVDTADYGKDIQPMRTAVAFAAVGV